MDQADIKIIIAALSLPFILITGIYLRKKSRPYNKLVFSVHKIIDLTLIVLSVIILRGLAISTTDGMPVFITVILAVLILLSFITGALQSFEKPPPGVIIITHKVASYMILVLLPLTYILFIYQN